MSFTNQSNKFKSFLIKYPKMASLGFTLIAPTLILETVKFGEHITNTGLSNLGVGITFTAMILSFGTGVVNLFLEATEDESFLKNKLKKSITNSLCNAMDRYNQKVFNLDKNEAFPFEQKNLRDNLSELVSLFDSLINEKSIYWKKSILLDLKNIKENKSESSQKEWNYYKNFVMEYMSGLQIFSDRSSDLGQSVHEVLFDLFDNKLSHQDKKYLEEKIVKNKCNDLSNSIQDWLQAKDNILFKQLGKNAQKSIVDNMKLSQKKHDELLEIYGKAKKKVKNISNTKEKIVFEHEKKQEDIVFESDATNNYLNYIKKENININFKQLSHQINTILNVQQATLSILDENNPAFIQEQLFLKNDIDKIFLHISEEIKLFNKIEKLERAKGKSELQLVEKKQELFDSHQVLINSLSEKVLDISNKIHDNLIQDLSSKQEVNKKFLSQKLG